MYGDNRQSEKYEIKAMEKILTELNKRNETKANILPIKFLDKASIPLNSEITNAYNLIAEKTNLGSQQEWLARLAYNYPGLELGTESSPVEISNILKAIYTYGDLSKNEKDDGYILDPETSTKEGMLVLGNFKFPIIDKTGQDMKRNIFSWGYEECLGLPYFFIW